MIKEEVIVALQQIDAKMLSKMFLAGAKNLENKKEWINELNADSGHTYDTKALYRYATS